MLTDLPVLLQVASRLPHEPYRPDIGWPSAACIQKAACHWSHAHRSLINSPVVTAKRLWALSLKYSVRKKSWVDPLACSFHQVSTTRIRKSGFFLTPALDEPVRA